MTMNTVALEPGDPVAIRTITGHPDILGGEPGEMVVIAVPLGKGAHLERLIRRLLLFTPEELGYLQLLDDQKIISEVAA